MTWYIIADITTMEKSGKSGRFYAKNGNIIRKNMMVVLYVHSDITVETVVKKKYKVQVNVNAWNDRKIERITLHHS